MAEGSDQEKTEDATPRKLQKAREEGQVAQTRELPSALVLGAALVVFSLLSTWMWDRAMDVFRAPFTLIGQVEVSEGSLEQIIGGLAFGLAALLLPLMGTIAFAGVLAHVGQIGLLWSNEALSLKPERIDPVQGFRRLFSLKSLAELVKSIAKVVIIGVIVYTTIVANREQMLAMTNYDPADMFAFVMLMTFRIFVRVGIVLMGLALLDYAYQRWEFERSLRMTRQEVVDEYRQTEGDPRVRARVRSIQREIAQRRMMAEVPKADVVITNPTHVAVALKYDAPQDPAPRVVAKGKGVIAEKIREKARAHGVPILERPELARTLFKQVKLAALIPHQLYQAVAEILAYVYSLKHPRSVAHG